MNECLHIQVPKQINLLMHVSYFQPFQNFSIRDISNCSHALQQQLSCNTSGCCRARCNRQSCKTHRHLNWHSLLCQAMLRKKKKNFVNLTAAQEQCALKERAHLKILPWLNFFPPKSPSHLKYSSTIFFVSGALGSSFFQSYDS